MLSVIALTTSSNEFHNCQLYVAYSTFFVILVLEYSLLLWPGYFSLNKVLDWARHRGSKCYLKFYKYQSCLPYVCRPGLEDVNDAIYLREIDI